ncbi:N-acetylglucosamine-6-phosphate deacetylase [Psychrobacillus sp. FJAT-21963]|uniref:N-acetylglucosamine-6-phosphate deacetylase n=1 Tax=Psychrobacillus sp. FJAT-21963 TaxID=1712028 RepID=UPI0006F22210|nr:N-acetylglucosamine-6-phosphate deacetylase [Psychrobacillus sp. FJAT-21963]KQL35341.1 N-acetylglucosamine-6-phosphate deacetylase [Psychrobacillus sp. FJAT-21963]
MPKTILISNVTIVNHDKEVVADLFLKDGKIEKIGTQLSNEADIHINGASNDWIVFPGFIDMHIHGSAGFDTMDATEEALRGMARSLVKEGTTSFLPTTMTQTTNAIETALKNIASFVSKTDEAEVLGIHVEGPYISPKRAGAQPLEYIIEPTFEQFDRWQLLSNNRIKQITIAPEVTGGLEFVETASSQGIVVSIGHSDASSEEVEKAVKLGVKQATHLYNQMRPFHHREPGVVGSALILDEIKTELIVDFIHCHPNAVKLAYRLKGASGIILITDAMRAKGLPNGSYDLGGQMVSVTEKGAHLSNGALAGSMLTMDQAIRHFRQATNCSFTELVSMSSTNAAKQLKLSNKGSIAEGLDADLVLLNKDLHVQITICRGQIVFEKET